MNYPTIERVRTADVESVLRWNRFLPSPRTPDQVKVINVIVTRLGALKEANPGEYVSTSKRIGW